MPYFRYRALTPRKRSISGRLWALDSTHALQQLEQQGMHKIFLKSPMPWERWLERLKPSSAQEQALCCRQLAILMNSGIPIVLSLEILLRQPLHHRLYQAYNHCLSAVQQGSSLSQAMRKSPAAFDSLYIGLVQVGEKTGNLVENLHGVAGHLEREIELRAKVRAALTYPLVVSALSLTMAYVMVQHILPRFINGLFAESKMELPWFTRALIQFTNFFQNPATVAVCAGLILTLIWLVASYVRTEAGQIQCYEQLMKLKPTRSFLGKVMAVRTARMLATGVDSGLTVSDSLQLTSQACANPYLSRFLEIAAEDLKDGVPLSRCIRAIPFMPPIMSGFIELGEEASGLPPVLMKAAEMMEMDIEEVIQTFTQLLEPILVGGLGAFVGFILIALFIPLYQMLGAS
ncbi:type II secretion system F family protein [bacterium]|nr:type II secretion system F family protein [bacterium]